MRAGWEVEWEGDVGVEVSWGFGPQVIAGRAKKHTSGNWEIRTSMRQFTEKQNGLESQKSNKGLIVILNDSNGEIESH